MEKDISRSEIISEYGLWLRRKVEGNDQDIIMTGFISRLGIGRKVEG